MWKARLRAFNTSLQRWTFTNTAFEGDAAGLQQTRWLGVRFPGQRSLVPSRLDHRRERNPGGRNEGACSGDRNKCQEENLKISSWTAVTRPSSLRKKSEPIASIATLSQSPDQRVKPADGEMEASEMKWQRNLEMSSK